MPLILEQNFPLGRFHATRWNQNPFEDRHGEWPPSPWRLLRALASRWFQYARETGDEDEAARNELLEQLALHPPAFHLPACTWRGEPAPRQYHKTEVAWTDAAAKAAAYKKSKTTLMVDGFHAISPTDYVYWVWDNVELTSRSRELLHELLKRVLYFGRAETHCRFGLTKQMSQDLWRCELSSFNKTDSPVLVATPGQRLNLQSLLASTDSALLKGRQIPPDTQWLYASLPRRLAIKRQSPRNSTLPRDLQLIQFAVGGRVFPEQADWVRVIERFRGCVLKHAARILSGGRCNSYRELTNDLRVKLKSLSGKDGDGAPVQMHEHPYFFLCPDEFGNPNRLIAYRRTPFDAKTEQPFEVEAILAASREPIFWQSRDPQWSLRLVPMPFETLPPSCCSLNGSKFSIWTSATPFVLPQRHRFRGNGRLRMRETAIELLRTSLNQALLSVDPEASVIGIQPLDRDGNVLITPEDQDPSEFKWVTIHETQLDRGRRLKGRARAMRPGYNFRIQFSQPIQGPLLVGHSCHFGLGLFEPASTPR